MADGDVWLDNKNDIYLIKYAATVAVDGCASSTTISTTNKSPATGQDCGDLLEPIERTATHRTED